MLPLKTYFANNFYETPDSIMFLQCDNGYKVSSTHNTLLEIKFIGKAYVELRMIDYAYFAFVYESFNLHNFEFPPPESSACIVYYLGCGFVDSGRKFDQIICGFSAISFSNIWHFMHQKYDNSNEFYTNKDDFDFRYIGAQYDVFKEVGKW